MMHHRPRRRHWRIPSFTLLALFLSSVLTLSRSYCQTPADSNELKNKKWGHSIWSTENGLPQNSVHQVLQTADGYLWIATEGGLSRFNGINFKTFNQENEPAFTSDDICCLAQGNAGSLWIGTSDGLIQYSANRFRRYSMSDGLPSSAINAIAASNDGTLAILTDSGLARLDGTRFISIRWPAVGEAYAIGSTDEAVLLGAVSKIGTLRLGAVQPLPVHSELPNERIEGIGTLPDHSIWLRTRSSIVIFKDAHKKNWTTGKDLPGNRVESFLVDSHGTLWIGTNKGLVSITPQSGQPRLQPEIGAQAVLSIFQDREDNLWVGTETAGLHMLREQRFRTLPELGDHVVTAGVQTSDGAVWVGTNGDGLDRWQLGSVKHFSIRDGLLSDVILTLAADRSGGIWIGTPDGLNHIQGSRIETYTSADGLPDDFIRSLLVDDDGSLWIGTRRGLTHRKDSQYRVWTRADGLHSDLVGALLKSSEGDIWIGTLDGLSRLHNGSITTYTTKDGLSGNVITSLLQDSHGTLWIGTKNNGLTRERGGRFTAVQRADLPKVIDALLGDGRGRLWIASTHGIVSVRISDLDTCGISPECVLRVSSYGYSDGMPTDEVSAVGHPSAWTTTDGLLWFGTRKGVAIANPNHLSENRTAPPVVIEHFFVDGIEIAPSAKDQTISPGHSRFDFEYAGLRFANAGRTNYRYILEGFDKDWTQAGSRRVAYYTNLPPQHYKFRVQAADDEGIWTGSEATVVFYVQPPFYRRIWFFAAVLAFLASIVALLYRLRVRRIRSQFDAVLSERTRIAREIHDTLAQGFVGVSVQLEVTSQLLAQAQISAAHQQIDQTRAFVRQGLADARRSIWELRANTSPDSLPVQLSSQVEATAKGKFTSKVEIGGTVRALPPNLEREILRIAQEALANVVRHANATQITVALRYHSSQVILTVADDGRGFDPNESFVGGGHFGLQGMRERAAQIGARLQIESHPGRGTKVLLEVPITIEKGLKNNV
jgi:signal transduction histidine kinase/ligand-binding sensor domain-containing protein